MDIKEKVSEGWVHAYLVIEVLGKPADYIEKALGLAIDKLAKEKKVELIERKVHKSRLAEKAKEAKEEKEKQEKPKTKVFSTFAEIEILAANMAKLVELIFDYMPSSVEIIEPTNIVFKLEDANALLNDLSARLHQYDALSKRLRLERQILIKRLEEEIKKNK